MTFGTHAERGPSAPTGSNAPAGLDATAGPKPLDVPDATEPTLVGSRLSGREVPASPLGRGEPGHGVSPEMAAIEFVLPDELSATSPPETRGQARDDVRLLVADGSAVTHARFRELPAFLRAGDLVVVNNSAMINAAVDARYRGEPAALHFSTWLDDGGWVVELRNPDGVPWRGRSLEPDVCVTLPAGARMRLREPWLPGGNRLWVADLTGCDAGTRSGDGAMALSHQVAGSPTVHHGSPARMRRTGGLGRSRGAAGDFAPTLSPGVDEQVPRVDDVRALLARHGRPITYSYMSERWSASYYRTVFGLVPGSAEMPSAGRPFTETLVTELVAGGVGLAPITLHTGVSSPETGEPPSPERFAVPEMTARLVNATHQAGGRVVAVGTTVTRALETASTAGGLVRPTAGWTELVLSGERRARVVDGLITGWHAPGASHLRLLESVVGASVVGEAYRAALESGYLWHEFGDAALLFRN